MRLYPLFLFFCTVLWLSFANAYKAYAELSELIDTSSITSILEQATSSWDGSVLSYSNTQHTLLFYPGNRRCIINGSVVWLHQPVESTSTNSGWQFYSADLTNTIVAIIAPPKITLSKCKVLLDPGHGGDDTGAKSSYIGLHESSFTYDLAERVSNHLARAGINAQLTRYDDQYLSLNDRIQLAKDADLFISLHANFAANQQAAGIETYIATFANQPGTGNSMPAAPSSAGNAFDKLNAALGFAIHSRIAPLSNFDRGLKRARFAVLRHAPCPAVLIEAGFLSNSIDSLLLADPAYQEILAHAIAEGIAATIDMGSDDHKDPDEDKQKAIQHCHSNFKSILSN